MAIGLFVDGAYCLKSFKPGILDYVKLRSFLEAELEDSIDEAYFFNAVDGDASEKTKRFHKALTYPPPTGPGFRVKLYWLQRHPLTWPKSLGGGPVVHPSTGTQYERVEQKAVDVGLVYHMTRSFHKRAWTKLVLVAGDADFHEPVQNLVQIDNVDLYLIGTLKTISHELLPYARRVFELDKEPLRSFQFGSAPPRVVV